MFLINAQVNLRLAQGSARGLADDVKKGLGDLKFKADLEFSSKAKQEIAELGRNLNALRASVVGLSEDSARAASAMGNFGNSLKNTAPQAKNTQQAISGTSNTLKTFTSTAKDASTAAENFGHQIFLAGKRFGAFTVATAGMFALSRAIRAGASEAVAFDLAMNKLSQVSDEGSRGVQVLRREIQTLSTSLGVASKDLSEAAISFAQAGIPLKDTTVALNTFAKALLNPNFGDAKNTMEGMIALYQQFGKDVGKLDNQMGSLAAVSAAFAVEAEDLVTAVQKAGGVFAATGGKVEELAALMTSVRATTRESADSIATGLRSIFTYVQRTETVDALKDLGIHLRRTKEEAKALGDVNLTDQFVGPYEAIQRLSAGLSKLRSTDPRYSQIVEDLGGVRQVSRVLPLIKEFAEAQRALNVARVGGASLEAAAATRQDAIATKLTRIRETYQQLANDLSESKGFKAFIDTLGDMSRSLADVLKNLSPLLPVLAGFFGAKAFKFGVGAVRGVGQAISNPPPVNPARQRFSNGGQVFGGSPGEDSVNARLMPGEFVLKKEAVDKLGVDAVKHMNEKGRVPRGYAEGGFRLPDEAYGKEIRKMDATIAKIPSNDTVTLDAIIFQLDKAFGSLGTLAEKISKTINNTVRELENKFRGIDAGSSSAVNKGLEKSVGTYKVTKESTEGGFLNFIRTAIKTEFGSQLNSGRFRLSTKTNNAVEEFRGEPFPEGQKEKGAKEFLKEHLLKFPIEKRNVEAEKFHLSTGPGETLSVLLGLSKGRPRTSYTDEIPAGIKSAKDAESSNLDSATKLDLINIQKKKVENEQEAAKKAAIAATQTSQNYQAPITGGSILRHRRVTGNVLNRYIDNSTFQNQGDDSNVDEILAKLAKGPDPSQFAGMSIREVAKKTGVSRSTIQDRLKRGMSIEEAVNAGNSAKKTNKGLINTFKGLNSLDEGFDQYSGDDSRVNKILGGIGSYQPPVPSPLALGYQSGKFPLVGPVPYTPDQMKFALPGGLKGGPGGFIIGDPSQNPATRGLKQEEEKYPVGLKSMFGLNLNPEIKTKGYSSAFGLSGIEGGFNLSRDQFNQPRAFGISDSPTFNYSTGPNKPWQGGGAIPRIGQVHGDSLFNPSRFSLPGFQDYADTKGSNQLKSLGLETSTSLLPGSQFSVRGKTTGEQGLANLAPEFAKTKSDVEVDKAFKLLVRGITKQIESLTPLLTATERLAVAEEIAATAYKQNLSVIRNKNDQAVGLTQLGSFDSSGIDKQTARDERRAAARDKLVNSRVGRFATSVNDKVKGVGSNGIIGLTFAAPLLGQQLSPDRDQLGSIVGNKSGEAQYTNQTKSSGALQGAALGAGAGLAFGPYGAVIGGLIGGFYGLADAAKKAASDINNAKLGNSLEAINQQLKPITQGRRETTSINQFDLLKDINQVRFSAISEATQKTEKPGFGSILLSSLTNKDGAAGAYADAQRKPDVYGKEIQKQLRVSLGGQAGDFANVAAREMERLVKENEDKTPEEIAKKFRKGIGGQLSDTLNYDIRGISKSQANSEQLSDINSLKQNQAAIKAIDKSAQEVSKIVTSLGRLTSAFNSAANATEIYKDRADVLNGGIGRIHGLTSGFEQFGSPVGNEFNSSVGGLSKYLGSAGESFRDRTTAANSVQSVLPEILAEVASRPFDEKNTQTKQVRDSLESKLGTKDPNIQAAISVIIGGLQEEARKNKGDSLKDARIDSSKLSKDLIEPFIGPFRDAGIKISRDIEDFFAGLLSSYNSLKQRVQAVDDQKNRGYDLQLNTERAKADLAADNLGGGGGGRLLSYQTLLQPFQSKQSSLLKGSGVGNEDVQGIKRKLGDTLSRQESAKDAVNLAIKQGNPGKAKEAIEVFTRLGYEADRFEKALKNLIDPTQKLAAIQERLSNLSEDRESRISFGERFLNADPDERAKIARGQRLAKILSEDQSKFAGLGGDNQRLAIRELRSIGQGQFSNGFTGNSLANKLIYENTGVRSAEKDKEIKDLLGNRVDTGGKAESANLALTNVLSAQNLKFLSNLNKSYDVFFSRLELSYKKIEVEKAKNTLNNLTGNSNKLNEEQEQFKLINKTVLGTTGSKEEIDAAIKKARSKEGVKSLDKFISRRDDFYGIKTNNEYTSDFKDILDKNPEALNSLKNQKDPEKRLSELVGIISQTSLPKELVSSTADQLNKNFPKILNSKSGKSNLLEATTESFYGTLGSDILPNYTQDKLKRFHTARDEAQGFGYNTDALTSLTNPEVEKLKGSLESSVNKPFGDLQERIQKNKDALQEHEDVVKKLTGQYDALSTVVESKEKDRDKSARESLGQKGSLFGIPLYKAGGGSIFESRGSDTVPAMLSPDEFVIRAKSAKANRALLEQINNSDGPLQGGLSFPTPGTPQAPMPQNQLNDKMLNRGGPVYLADGGDVDYPHSDYTGKTKTKYPGRSGKGIQTNPPQDLLNSINPFNSTGLDNFGKRASVAQLSGFRAKQQINSLMFQQALAGTEDSVYATGIDRLRNQDEKNFRRFDEKFGQRIRSIPQQRLAIEKKTAKIYKPGAGVSNGGIGRGAAGLTNDDFRTLPNGQEVGGRKGYGLPGQVGADNVPPKGFAPIAPDPSGYTNFINPKRFANGGVVTGGVPGQDSVPALLTPGERVIPNGQAGEANQKQYEQTAKLAGSMNLFTESAGKLNSAFVGFSEKSEALAAAMDRFPREVTHTGSFDVNVNHNGAEVFGEINKSVETMIMKTVSSMLDQKLNERFPESTSKPSGNLTSV